MFYGFLLFAISSHFVRNGRKMAPAGVATPGRLVDRFHDDGRWQVLVQGHVDDQCSVGPDATDRRRELREVVATGLQATYHCLLRFLSRRVVDQIQSRPNMHRHISVIVRSRPAAGNVEFQQAGRCRKDPRNLARLT